VSMSPGSRDSLSSGEQWRLASRKPSLLLRARMTQAIRRFFVDHDYLEVETPHLIPAPAPEPHIDAIKVGDLFLHASPELCMKRLLAAGYPGLFQICRSFRQAERGHLHLPEFTLLEWYRAGIDYLALMAECEEMILFVSRELGLGETLEYGDREINLQGPWQRISVGEAFDQYASISMEEALRSERFDEVMVTEIEPHMGIACPAFLYDYPAPLAALARIKQGDPAFAERFELYIGGLEIANAFSELTDAHEQRARFERDSHRRTKMGKTAYPVSEKFLMALPHMPPSAGIALGVDRLAMVFANQPSIDHVVTFTPEEL
jgi:lysyl-tRNA synthetase class 2